MVTVGAGELALTAEQERRTRADLRVGPVEGGVSLQKYEILHETTGRFR